MHWPGSTLKAVFIMGVMGVIALSLLPPKHTPSLLGDKLEHLIAYAFLGLVGCLAFQTRRATLWLIALLPSLAIALELAQEFAPGRSTEIADAAVRRGHGCRSYHGSPSRPSLNANRLSWANTPYTSADLRKLTAACKPAPGSGRNRR
jgi:hypothetical protein